MVPGIPWHLGEIECNFKHLKNPVFGVSIPFEFEGSPGSTFAIHVEDLHCYSVNYLVSGAPKHWFIVPLSHHNVFIEVMQVII